MKKQIWKYPLEITGTQEIEMPVGAQSLSVQVQHGHPRIWAMVDTEAEKETRLVQIFGTGHSVENEGSFIGTFQVEGGSLVFHAFIK